LFLALSILPAASASDEKPSSAPAELKHSEDERILAKYGAKQVLTLLSTNLAVEELRLTDDQRAKLTPMRATFRDRDGKWHDEISRLPEKQVQEMSTSGELLRSYDRMEAPTLRELAALLDLGQIRRIDEINLQTVGPWFFDSTGGRVSPEEFNLSPRQQSAVARITKDHEQAAMKLHDLYAAAGPRTVTEKTWQEHIEHNRRRRELFRQSALKVAAELTPDQRRKFDEMRGREVDLDRLDRELDAPFFSPSPDGTHKSYTPSPWPAARQSAAANPAAPSGPRRRRR
jgi:hypothetical protein